MIKAEIYGRQSPLGNFAGTSKLGQWIDDEFQTRKGEYMSSSLYKNFKMDDKKEKDGIWVEPAPANDDGSIPGFLIARISSNNQRFKKAMERECKPYNRLIALGTLSNEKADKIKLTVFLNSILLGWRNVQNEDGSEMPFSAENALKLFTDLPDLWAELDSSAQNASLFKLDEQETIVKNL